MTGSITWEQITALLVIAGSVSGIWIRLEKRFNAVRDDLEKLRDIHKADLMTVRENLTQFKLDVADRYVRTGYLKDVENRIMKRLDDLISEIHQMRQDRGPGAQQ